MNRLQGLRKQVLNRRDLLFEHFEVIQTYLIHKKLSLDSFEPDKVDLSAHDHVISSEIDLSDEYSFLFAVEVNEFGVLPDGEDVSAEMFVSETDEFSLQLDVSQLFRHNRIVKLQGAMLGGTSLELLLLDSGIIFKAWGLSKKEIPTEFFKETLAEALSFELEGRLKQGFFLYMTAIDSFIGLCLSDLTKYKELHDHLTYMKIEEKLSLSLKRFVDRDSIDDIPLMSYVKDIFSKCLKYRNDIAHSSRSVKINEGKINDVVFLTLVLQMMREIKSADMEELKSRFSLSDKVKTDQRMPRKTKERV